MKTKNLHHLKKKKKLNKVVLNFTSATHLKKYKQLQEKSVIVSGTNKKQLQEDCTVNWVN